MGSAVFTGTVTESSGAVFQARVLDDNNVPVTTLSLSALTFTVYALPSANDPGTVVYSGTISPPGSAFFDSLQSWNADDTGFNFQAKMSHLAFPQGNDRYRVEYKLTPVSGEPFFLLFEVDALQIFTS